MENVKVQSKYFFSDSSVYTSYFPLFCVFAPTALEMEHKGDKTKPSRMRVFILSDFRKYFKQNEMRIQHSCIIGTCQYFYWYI